MDGVSCGTKVFLFQSGAKVVHALQVDRLIESVVDRTAGILVARKNHRHHKLAAEARLRTSRRDAFGNFGDFLFVTTIGSPERRIMSGRNSRMRWICSCGFRPSLAAMVSITMAPAPRAARLALQRSLFDTPPTIICSPPPAELVEM